MSGQLGVGIAGIGGYGNHYLGAMLENAPEPFRFVGAIDPSPSSCAHLPALAERKIPIYPSLQAFYEKERVDLMIICTPLQLHAEQTCLALSHGNHVLCEKPLCVTPEQMRQMIDARARADRHVAIGYQWSYSQAIQDLKSDILAGKLGRPLRLRSLVLWPRDEIYYRRNRWAGAMRDRHGNWVLDSPVNNACAHYLHNMFYMLGRDSGSSARPAQVTAELYRANEIENYDTAVLRSRTRDGIDLMLVVSHATLASQGPVLLYEFEKASVHFSHDPGATITARFVDGTTKDYGSPNDNRHRKLWLTMKAVGANQPPLCGIEAAASHMLCTWAAQQSAEVTPFPADLVQIDGGNGTRRTWVSNLDQDLKKCFDEFKLPSELGLNWARPAAEVAIHEGPLSDAALATSH